MPASVAQLDARSDWRQEVVGSTPAEVGNILSWRFVCVEVYRPSQPNVVMSSAVSLPSHTFTGQA